jgi:hypothetical protein
MQGFALQSGPRPVPPRVLPTIAGTRFVVALSVVWLILRDNATTGQWSKSDIFRVRASLGKL